MVVIGGNLGYIAQMSARCGKSVFLKQKDELWELVGNIVVTCCHEPPVLSNTPNGRTWEGAVEVSSPEYREYSVGSWSGWGESDTPLLLMVYQQKGRWHAEELEKTSCADVAALGSPQQTGGSFPSGWLFSDSGTRLLTLADVSNLSAEQLWVAKNEIYARHGFIFKTKKGQAYAASLGDRYHPETESPILNATEQKNVSFLQYLLDHHGNTRQ